MIILAEFKIVLSTCRQNASSIISMMIIGAQGAQNVPRGELKIKIMMVFVSPWSVWDFLKIFFLSQSALGSFPNPQSREQDHSNPWEVC